MLFRRGGSGSGSDQENDDIAMTPLIASTMQRGGSDSTEEDELYHQRRDAVLPHLQEYYESQKETLPWCWYCVCRRFVFGACTSVHPFRVRFLDWVSQLLFYYSGGYSPGGQWDRAKWDSVAVQFNSAPPGLDKRHNVFKRDLDIDTPHGVRLPIRIYESKQERDDNQLKPLMLFIHGGGFCIGTRDQRNHDELCSWYARDGFVVVSLTYRMAPEDPFPAAVHDCYDLMRWMVDESQSGQSLPGDRSRFVVAGDSAGGNLSTVLACLNMDGLDADLQPTDVPSVNIVYQMLLYPVFYKCPSSVDTNAKGDKAFFISKPVRTWFGEAYQPVQGLTEREIIQRTYDQRLQPYARPKGCLGLPPCTIISADCDLLTVEHVEVVDLLRKAGNKCRHHVYKDVPHGFATFDFLPQAEEAYLKGMEDMRQAGVFDST